MKKIFPSLSVSTAEEVCARPSCTRLRANLRYGSFSWAEAPRQAACASAKRRDCNCRLSNPSACASAADVRIPRFKNILDAVVLFGAALFLPWRDFTHTGRDRLARFGGFLPAEPSWPSLPSSPLEASSCSGKSASMPNARANADVTCLAATAAIVKGLFDLRSHCRSAANRHSMKAVLKTARQK